MPYYGALTNPIFEPALRDIIDITNADPAVVTTGTAIKNMPAFPFPHDYLSGLIVRLVIPPLYGMMIDPSITFVITVLTPTTFSIPLDTTHFDAFIIPIQPAPQPNIAPAQCTPVGEVAAILTQSFVNILTPQF